MSRVAGENMDALLYDAVLGPLGVREVAWSRCPHGFPIGATGLYIRADGMVKLRWLYLNRGGLIGKGGMYGQGLYFSERGRFAVAWHVFEKGACMSALMEHLGALG